MNKLIDSIIGAAIITSLIALFLWCEFLLVNWLIYAHITFEQIAMFGAGVLFVVLTAIFYFRNDDE